MLKEIFYDFNGLNYQIFSYINSLFGKKNFDICVILVQIFAENKLFFLYFPILSAIAAYSLYSSKNNKTKLHSKTMYWLEFLSNLSLATFISCTLIIALKYIFHFKRPFCTAGFDDIYIVSFVVEQLNCERSFPSGHVSFITVMVTSFWPYLKNYQKILAPFLIIFVAITRIASGAHFPADLIWAFLIALSVVVFTRKLVKKFLTSYSHFIKILIPWMN